MSNTEAHDPDTGEVHEGVIESSILGGTAMSVISAEIDIQIATSKRYPRAKDKVVALKIMDRATLNADIAAECLYSVPRDSKTITGPSIRFAEIVRSCYGNMRVASRFVRIDADDKMRQAVIVEAVAFDTEMNDTELGQVRRSIMTSAKGGAIPRPFSVDMVGVTVMAAQAIARRNAILSLVPKAVWIDALAQVERVIKGDEKTLNERRAKMLVEFAKFSVTPEELFAAMGVESEQEIGLNDMPVLMGMWTRLKDGEAAESVLGMAPGTRPTQGRHKTVDSPMRGEPAGAPTAAGQSTSADTTSSEEAEKHKRTRRTKAEMEAARAATQQHPADKSDPGPIPDSLKRPVPEKVEEPAETRDREAEQRHEDWEAAAPKPAAPVQSEYEKMLDHIGTFKGSAGGLMDWWRSKRKERAELSFEEQGHVSKVYNGKFSELDAE
jgi:hypothetical protein